MNSKHFFGGNILLLILVFASLLPTPVFAYDKIVTDRKVNLTIVYETENGSVVNAEFYIFKVAGLSESADFYISDDFKEAGISLNTDITLQDWYERAATLEAYLTSRKDEENAIPPVAKAVTDTSGKAEFSDLEVGLYLLVGKTIRNGDVYYIPLENMICLPSLTQDMVWDYSPTAYIKGVMRLRETEPMDLSAVKIWEDNGWENLRPSSIEITLYRNGKEYSTIELNAQNNWRYVWEDLDPNSTWDVVEKRIPQGYTVTVVQEGEVFVLTNTVEVIPPTPTEFPTPTPGPEASSTPMPTPDDRPNPQPTPDRSLSATAVTSSPPTEQPVQKLPQTGQMWWPVSLLAGSGLLLFMLGWILQNKGN